MAITGWEAGTEPDALRRLAEHWADGFGWRTHERAINALPSYREVIDGVPVSYLRFDAETMNATPIILTHGWPSTILEEVELARSLAYPSEHGAIGATSFTVIVPALPGFPLAAAQQTIPGIPTTSCGTELCPGSDSSSSSRSARATASRTSSETPPM